MPHTDAQKFAQLAKKRESSLPRKGEFRPRVHTPQHPSSQQGKPASLVQEEKVAHQGPSPEETSAPREKLHGYDIWHRNPYAHHEALQPKITLSPSSASSATSVQEPVPLELSKMTTREKVNFIIMRTLGNFLLFFSLYGVAATFGPALYFEGQYRIAQARGIEYTVSDPIAKVEEVEPTGQPAITPAPTIIPDSPGFGAVLAGEQEQILVPPDTQFSIVIPKIGATSKVHPNVDPLDENEFLPRLQTGVAHAKGTVFPGMHGNTYLFAHSTDNFWNVGRYNAVFYLIKELKPGDEIIVFFEDRRYNYKVERTEIKDASDVELLTQSQRPGKEQLILQTCWPPGTTWKRLFVIATPQ